MTNGANCLEPDILWHRGRIKFGDFIGAFTAKLVVTIASSYYKIVDVIVDVIIDVIVDVVVGVIVDAILLQLLVIIWRQNGRILTPVSGRWID